MRKLMLASVMLCVVAQTTPAAAKVVYIPAILWHAAGPIEWLFNKLTSSDPADERGWEMLPPRPSYAACEKAIGELVKDFAAVKEWRCVRATM
jgi:hypothetical protein